MAKIQKRARNLDAHGIDYRIIDDRLIALDYFTREGKLDFERIDVTDWSVRKLLAWLGY